MNWLWIQLALPDGKPGATRKGERGAGRFEAGKDIRFCEKRSFYIVLGEGQEQLDVALCWEVEGPGLVKIGSWDEGAQDKAAAGFWEEDTVVLNQGVQRSQLFACYSH